MLQKEEQTGCLHKFHHFSLKLMEAQMRSNTVEVNWSTAVVNKRWRLTINMLRFCSCLLSPLPQPRQHVCAMCPLCEETFPTSIPRDASGGAGINNSQVRWTQVPLLSSLPHTGLMDLAIILLKGGDYFEHGEMAKCTHVILKNTGVYFGWDQASEDTGYTVLILPALWQDERDK